MNRNTNDNVFINCPFDKEYKVMFRASVFTVLDAGFIPRCALEVDDASQFRLNIIISLIDCCKYGIHDLSRVEIDPTTRLPRFNMPYELGLFHSAKYFGSNNHKNKKCIILETERYRYREFISDISGMDVKAHDDSVETLIRALRNWLVNDSRRRTIPPAEKIIERFQNFLNDFEEICQKHGIDNAEMPFIELVQNMTDWLKINQITHAQLF